MNKFSSIFRYAILVIFPLGWWFASQEYSYDFNFIQEFSYLTAISTMACAFILYRLKEPIVRQIHLWSIFVIFLLGHYIEFFLKLYWNLTDNILLKRVTSASARVLLSSPDIIIEAYRVATTCMCSLMIAIYWVRRKQRKVKASFFQFEQLKIPERQLLKRPQITKYVIILIIVSIILLGLQINFALGRHTDQYVESVTLPFKLAGIIHYGNTIVVPAGFLMLIYLADIAHDNSAFWVGTFGYLIQSIFVAIVTTSKTPITQSLISLFLIWKFSNHLTRLRLSLLAIVIPFLPFSFSLLVGMRYAREVGEVGSLEKIPQVLDTLSNLSQTEGSDYSFYTLLVRFNGMDTLMDFIGYSRSYDILFDFNGILDLFNMDFIYGSKVLGIEGYGTGLFQLGISSGFTGSLYFIFLNAWVVGFALFLFIILWDKLFSLFLGSSLLIKPFVLIQIAMIGCIFISEGNWTNLPVLIGVVFGVAFLGEPIARAIMGRSNQISII